jgi:carbonic anhydrase/SulP family sulfate permease
MAGLIAGIVGGLLVSWLSGSHTSVSGPAAGLTAVVIAQLETLGSFEAFLVAVFIAGGIQIALGIMRAGSFAAFFPSSVIKGLLAAIGIILILKQFPHLFGHDPDWMGDMGFLQRDGKNTFSEITATMFDIHPGAMTVGICSLLLLIFWNRIPLKKSGLPAPLGVVVLGVVIAELFRWFQGPQVAETANLFSIGGTHLIQVPVTERLDGFINSLNRPS